MAISICGSGYQNKLRLLRRLIEARLVELLKQEDIMSITYIEMAQIIAAAQIWEPFLGIVASVTTEDLRCRRTRLLVSYGSMRLSNRTMAHSCIVSAVRVWELQPPCNVVPVEYILTPQAPVYRDEEVLELLTRRTRVLRNVSYA